MKQSHKIVAAIAGFALFETLLMLFVDRPVALFTHNLDDTHHALIDFFRRITDLGKSCWYLWPCGVIAVVTAFLSRAKDGSIFMRRLSGYLGARCLFLFLTIAASGIAADIIKPIVGRARPIVWLRDGIFGFHPFTAGGSLWNGMPSGHTATAFTLACALTHLYPRLRIVWFAYALLLASSRIMVDAHYLSDVCAGALLGYLTVHAFLNYRKIHLWHVIFPIDSPAPRL